LLMLRAGGEDDVMISVVGLEAVYAPLGVSEEEENDTTGEGEEEDSEGGAGEDKTFPLDLDFRWYILLLLLLLLLVPVVLEVVVNDFVEVVVVEVVVGANNNERDKDVDKGDVCRSIVVGETPRVIDLVEVEVRLFFELEWSDCLLEGTTPASLPAVDGVLLLLLPLLVLVLR